MSDIKSKEEILNKHDSSRKYIEQTCRPELFAAMDEYEKKQSICFLEWADGEDYECVGHTDENVKIWQGIGGTFTTDKLHDKFLDHQLKQQP